MKITGPGAYRMRNGNRVDVYIVIWEQWAFGTGTDAMPMTWFSDTGCIYAFNSDDSRGDEQFDIVGPWTEPEVTWEPTGRRRYFRIIDNTYVSRQPGLHHWLCNHDGPGWFREHIEQRSPSGETRWVPVEVEE